MNQLTIDFQVNWKSMIWSRLSDPKNRTQARHVIITSSQYASQFCRILTVNVDNSAPVCTSHNLAVVSILPVATTVLWGLKPKHTFEKSLGITNKKIFINQFFSMLVIQHTEMKTRKKCEDKHECRPVLLILLERSWHFLSVVLLAWKKLFYLSYYNSIGCS